MTTTDLEQLVEGHDLEVKLAFGRDGRGELPASFFETYSAFANTDGGIVLLGVQELADGKLVVKGITETPKVVRALWDGLNNKQRVNANLLRKQDVEVLLVEGKAVIRVVIPRATRRQRPVYIGDNPFGGSFRRNNEGDYRCPEDVVRRMIAEQVEDTRDAHILRGFDMEDLDATTIAKYRQRYLLRSPEHVWNSLDDKEFLRSIGAFGSDREAGIVGITSAGLLMFGKLVSIKDAFPNFMLDFQERAEPRSNSRWLDRLTTDGSWSGNLFDFYLLIIQRLFRDLRVPFQLRGDTRMEETPIHEALREALVNTLIHADYTGRVSLLVVKRSDNFVFRNPGSMRMPVETAFRGGESDCRNRRLQDMFRYVGLGEQAGSGIPKIHSAWRTQHWRSPEMAEQLEPNELTTFTLRMASLLPSEVVQELEQRFGDAFDQASEVQKLALVTAAVERSVTHARLRSMTDVHPRDVSVALSSLVQRGMLESGGSHKRTFYFLPGDRPRAEATPASFESTGLEPVKAEVSGDFQAGQQESRPESRPESRQESQLESRQESQLESRLESRLKSQLESQQESRPESQQESRLESRLESGLESRLESQLESGAVSRRGVLAEKVLVALGEGPRSRSEISRAIGQRKVSGQLNIILKDLLGRGLIEYTVPEKPGSRLQKYRLTSRKG